MEPARHTNPLEDALSHGSQRIAQIASLAGAMARYDRLRSEGLSPLDAMQEAAPLFGHSPTTRTGDPAPPRSALGPGDGQAQAMPAAPDLNDPPADQQAAPTDEPAERRGQQIVARLQARAHAARHPDLGPDELAMILDAVTNLPPDVIDHLAHQFPTGPRTHHSPDRSAAQLAAQSFPHTAHQAIRAATMARDQRNAKSPATTRSAHKPQRPKRTL